MNLTKWLKVTMQEQVIILNKKTMKQDLIPYYKWCYGKFVLVGYIKK
jgi:hypothetical protein